MWLTAGFEGFGVAADGAFAGKSCRTIGDEALAILREVDLVEGGLTDSEGVSKGSPVF